MRYHNYKKHITKLLLLTGSLLSLSSCNFLDITDNYFSDEISSDSIFANSRNTIAYIWDISRMFPDEGNLIEGHPNTLGPLATDEAFSNAKADITMKYITGEINSKNLGNFEERYSNNYKAIRRCNTVLSNLNKVPNLNTTDRKDILGYTHFMRAYAYYRLLIDWGPTLLLGNDIIPNNEELKNYDRERGTYDECVDYICNEFEESAKYLPTTQSIANFGRPTKGAAYGLIARLRIYQASPAYNGGEEARRCFGNWKRKSDGAFYINQTYDEKRWAIAAAACLRVIEMKKNGNAMYHLHTVESSSETPDLPTNVSTDPDFLKPWPIGAAGIDPFHSYADMFNGEDVIPSNPEWVWARYSNDLTAHTQQSFPAHLSGFNHYCVTQKVIDAYRMVDGNSIEESSSEYPYSETGFTTSQKKFSGYRLNSGVYNMYNNREMRFYASIGFSECFWPMTSTSTVGNYNQTITYYYDSPNGKQSNVVDYPITGYVIKKFINPTDAWAGTNSKRLTKAYPIIRYADILLMYAEALNHLTTTHTVQLDKETYTLMRNTDEIRKTFNLVRHRAGLPGMSVSEVSDVNTVQKLIEQERMIELLFENERYYDVRRWGKYEESELTTITGMNVEGTKSTYYQRTIPNSSRIGARVVNRKMMFMPIPNSEIRKLPSMSQNPGWD
jgi:susD homolog